MKTEFRTAGIDERLVYETDSEWNLSINDTVKLNGGTWHIVGEKTHLDLDSRPRAMVKVYHVMGGG
jgi:hypothetical protein